jgi:hypothetical protein
MLARCTVGLTTVAHALPQGLAAVPLADMPPRRLVLAWTTTNPGPLVRTDRGDRLPPGPNARMNRWIFDPKKSRVRSANRVTMR